MFESEDERKPGADFENSRVNNEDAFSRATSDGGPTNGDESRKRHPLDSAANNRFHSKLKGMYQQEIERQSDNRQDMAVDADYYDNIQWTEHDARELRERGQDPLVFNVISASVNWVTGTEKRGRIDYKILARRKEDSKPAEKKTQLMKYLSDVNRTPFARSRAFEDAVKVGIGFIESGVTAGDDGEPIYTRYESWRNILWDSACTSLDFSDCRYMFRTKWVDMDIAERMFKDRIGILRASAGDTDRFGLDAMGDDAMDSAELAYEPTGALVANGVDYQRQRVRLIEAWIKVPADVKSFKSGAFKGDVFEPYNQGHVDAYNEDDSILTDRQMMRMRVAIFCDTGMLYIGDSPYRHNKFPFTPIWCYRRDRDGMPYGMIRGMRDLQYDINKRAAKALHILSTNKTIMDEGAVDNVNDYLEEISRPDAVIVKKQGKELVINADRDLAPIHMEFMSRSISMIQQQSGVTDENMGRKTNATSGVAIGRRQEQGAMATAGIFDNLRLAAQIDGEKELSLIEQYMDEEKQFRITNMRGVPDYITVNDGLPENDIVHTKADFVISESDWRATIRQNATEELTALLMQLAPAAPQLAMVMLDLVVEEMDIGNREELVKRIREVTGMRDPDQEEPTPEEIQRMEAERAQQEQMAAQQQAMFEAELAIKQGTAKKLQADSDKTVAAIQEILANVANKGVDAQRSALETALAMLSTPEAAQAADVVLQEAGFVGQTQKDQQAQQQQEQEAMEQQQAMEQEQQQAEQQAADEHEAMLQQQDAQQGQEGQQDAQPAMDGQPSQPMAPGQ